MTNSLEWEILVKMTLGFVLSELENQWCVMFGGVNIMPYDPMSLIT